MKDIAGIVGFVVLAGGLWWLSPPWAMIVCGSLALAGGVYGTIRGKKPHDS